MRSILLVLVGCGAAVPAAAPPAPSPPRPRASYTVLMGELGDPGIDAKLVHHARLLRHGRAWVRLDIAPNHDRDDTELAERSIVPVVGETRDRVRVVSTDDDARIALWIDRGDLAPTTVAPTELFDDRGERGDGVTGVWLEPGADLDSPATRADPRAITVRDPQFKVTGTVPAAAIGTVWVGAVPPLVERNNQPPFLESTAKVFATPRADARVLASVIDDMPSVKKLATRSGWTEIEFQRGAMRVRGFAHDGDVTNERCCLMGHGTGSGHGYGISDTDEVVVTANACLYDREGGEVIGVNTKQHKRFGYYRHGAEWARVYIGTQHWGTVEASVHVAKRDGDVTTWESCAAH